MECEVFESYTLGKIEEEVYRRHALNCSVCRNLQAQDKKMLKLSKSLERYSASPALWERIESALEVESRKQKERWGRRIWIRTHPVLRWAAVIVLIFVLGRLFWPVSTVPQNGLLTSRILIRVERKERAYFRAISHLEKRVTPGFEKLDLELSLLYQDRLETIDAQIRTCREALEGNPANGHIRRYMLAALQDKQKTLREIREYRRKT